jgi:Bacterial Ig-like domain (group 3)
MRIKSLAKGLSALFVSLLGGVAVAQHSTASYTQIVNQAPGTIAIASSLNPSGYTQPVTFTATVPATATGTVTFFDGATKINTAVTVVSGSAATTISTLSVGNHSISATFTPDATSNYASVSTAAALIQTVGTGPSGIALTSSPNPSTFGSNVAFTATLASTATGNVTFYDTTTSTSLGVVTASSGTAVLNISSLAVGTHNVTAQYAGDSNFAAGTSAKDAQVVNKAGTTSDVLTSSLNPATYGVAVTFTATLPTNATGTVTFLDNGTSIGTGTLVGGVATFTISNLTVQSHPITASYPGDSNYASTTSNTVTETINQKTGEIITLTSSANPAVFGTSVVFTAKLPTDATGTVTFYDGATSIGTGTVTAGVATFTTSTLSVKTHPITATYGGDTNYGNVTSTAVAEEIDPAGATMTISGAPNPSTYGGAVVMTITVTGVNGVIPTGTVTLVDGSNPLGSTLTLDATGKATYTTSALTAGSHSITATYSGDSNYK